MKYLLQINILTGNVLNGNILGIWQNIYFCSSADKHLNNTARYIT